MDRRGFLKTGSLAAAASLATPVISAGIKSDVEVRSGLPASQQSASYWCFNKFALPDLLPRFKAIGLTAIDLITPEQWPVLQQHGFHCSMAYGRENEDITTGFIDEHLHDELYAAYAKTIPVMAEYGYKNMVCFAGNRRGRFDLDGLRIAARGIKRLIPIAREHGVVLNMELFNSKVNHPDCMADSSSWGITLCDMVDSDHFKLLFDIYHMQVQEGNIIQTIKDFHPYFGHYHTAGVPGRHEIGDNQELNYPAIAKAIRATGFTGYLAHEFIPTAEDPIESLREAIAICS